MVAPWKGLSPKDPGISYLAPASFYARILFPEEAAQAGWVLRAKPEISKSVAPSSLVPRSSSLSIIFSAGQKITLKIPLKKNSTLISDHDNWQHKHCQAIQTAYSRTTYYPHYAPEILQTILQTKGKPTELDTLLQNLHLIIIGALAPSAALLQGPLTETQAKICKEKLHLLRPDVSIIDLLFRLGPEAIFPLRATLL